MQHSIPPPFHLEVGVNPKTEVKQTHSNPNRFFFLCLSACKLRHKLNEKKNRQYRLSSTYTFFIAAAFIVKALLNHENNQRNCAVTETWQYFAAFTFNPLSLFFLLMRSFNSLTFFFPTVAFSRSRFIHPPHTYSHIYTQWDLIQRKKRKK